MRQPSKRARRMRKPKRTVESHGYIRKVLPNGGYEVIKLEFRDGGEYEIVTRHQIINGICDCEGFQHRKKCRHVTMCRDRDNAAPVSRRMARKAMQAVMNGLQGQFDEIEFAGYDFVDEEEEMVTKVNLVAYGSPYNIDGESWPVISGIRDGAWVEIEIRTISQLSKN